MQKTFRSPLVMWASTFLLTHVMVSSSAWAWETDNVTCATKKIGDSTQALNDETNRRIRAALNTSNRLNKVALRKYKILLQNRVLNADFDNEVEQVMQETQDPTDETLLDNKFGGMNLAELEKGEACSVDILAEVLKSKLAGGWTDNLETWADAAPIPKCDIAVSDSVYSVFTALESPVAKSAGINPVISVGGVNMGVDKLSHFMTEGYTYWKKTKPDYDLAEALEVGTREEEGGYGLSTTGVKSFGDMSANYKGFTFWKSMFEGDHPYFRCEDGKWKQERDFDWKDYVDQSLDESINCSAYSTPEMTAKIDAHSAKIWEGTSVTAKQCPRSVDDCKALAKSITPKIVQQTILHPRCLQAAGVDAPPEVVNKPKPKKPRENFKLGSSKKKKKKNLTPTPTITIPKMPGGQQ